MQGWIQFYAVTGAAAATLMGLLFVAVSVNLVAAFDHGPTGSRRHIEQAFENYLAVLMVSLIELVPNLDLTRRGCITLAVTAGWSIWVVRRLFQAMGEPSAQETAVVAIRRHLPTLIGFGLLVSAAAYTIITRRGASNLTAVSIVILLFSATSKAWTFLDRLAQRAVGEKR